ncbi:SUMF1/EgtB/PvdO family nonheme iron enzyme [Lentisphaerota bacterium WC36G]|nr:SUMF1/EgtB/PvdO family nonheme iron enzyme [Lentisphaerae bacterium WC36]
MKRMLGMLLVGASFVGVLNTFAADKELDSAIMAVKDILKHNPGKYPKGREYLKKLQAGDKSIIREALLANPILDFDNMLVIKRKQDDPAVAKSVYIQTDVKRNIFSEIVRLSNLRGELNEELIYQPKQALTISDLDVNFSDDKIMFSKTGTHNRWQVFQYDLKNKKLEQLTPTEYDDIDSFDSCYLPSGDIVFMSTAPFQGLPCEFGRKPIANMYKLNMATKKIRQLTFDQDSGLNPTMLESGRVLYTRWEYSDQSHFYTRILMSMNPDGTDQKEYYGSNSYWPNTMYFSKPIPGNDSQFITVVTGHHTGRPGRLVLFDIRKGRREISGVIQPIPGRDEKIKNEIVDALYANRWPKFLNPQPLGTNPSDGAGKYFIVSGKLSPKSPWGIYLVDVFDNIIPISEGKKYFEPILLNNKKTPDVIPGKVDLGSNTAVFYVANVYAGQGLPHIPKGTVKALRVFEYDFAYMQGGSFQSVGVECSWDVKRILGTVEVEKDGSVMFVGPANTPIAVQPLDENGQAIQLMKSWMVGMPGENLTCIGCHESQNDAVKVRRAIASTKPPKAIKPWYGKPRGFSFKNEVQNEVINRYCISCHDAGSNRIPDFESQELVEIPEMKFNHVKLPKAYLNLHRYVRRPGPESDNHIDNPMEYVASTSELIRILKKGHRNVQMPKEAWERLYTWIDLNVPYNGSWKDAHRHAYSGWAGSKSIKHQNEQMARYTKARNKYAKLFANRDVSKYNVHVEKDVKVESIRPKALPKYTDNLSVPDVAVKTPEVVTYNIDGEKIDFVQIPTGKFVMGSKTETVQERPRAIVEIKKPFLMATTEVSNALYAKFNKEHDSRYYPRLSHNQTDRGWPLNKPEQPVVRVSFDEAMDFCKWLSGKIGKKVTIPTEAQWEWAARGGTTTDMFYGSKKADFSKFANLADYNLRWFGVRHGHPLKKVELGDYRSWLPRIKSVNDNAQLSTKSKSYAANAFGLYDMIGNVSEWTRSRYWDYPYDAGDGRNNNISGGDIQIDLVIRGGSWITRPKYATSSYRYGYKRYQKVFDVGIRLIIED